MLNGSHCARMKVRQARGNTVKGMYQVNMVPVLISPFQQGDIGVPSQVMHDLYFTPHILYILR